MTAKKRDRSYKGKINPEQVLARQNAFIVAYGECGTIKSAALAAEVGRSTVNEWVRNDVQNFKAKFAEAKDIYADTIQDMAWKRVQNQKPSDNPVLLLAHLNAHVAAFRKSQLANVSEVKEMMAEWKRFERENRKAPGKSYDLTDTEMARRNAVDEVEKLLARKRNDNTD